MTGVEKKKKIWAVIDCNNFFVSCERVFNPKLDRVPVVVLSNNDGCIISRSNEAKALGIPMGAPLHEVEQILDRNGVQIFSSNFVLYGDLSRRVMITLSNFVPDLEIYSIDEAFLPLHNLHITDLTKWAKEIVQTVKKNVGIPISIGIAGSKTLAKVANRFAKKHPELEGVLDLTSNNNIDQFLEKVLVEDVWGIGRRISLFLRSHSIYNALQFKNASSEWVRANLGINGTKMQTELAGIEALGHIHHQTKKSITSSRSFGTPVFSFNDLAEAVSSFTERAAENLRQEKAVASFIGVSVRTGKHTKKESTYRNFSFRTIEPTMYTPDLIKNALECLREIYKKGVRYKKAAVFLSGIVPATDAQLCFFGNESVEGKKNLMQAMDKLNFKYGSRGIRYASTGNSRKWKPKRERLSKLYTTSWDDILNVS